MLIVDSCGWLDALTSGPLAGVYRELIEANPEQVLVPSIILYEVYKISCLRRGEVAALEASLRLQQHRVAHLDADIALQAADASLAYKLAMADALILATAQEYHAELVTSDVDLEGLPGVRFIPKPKD